MAYKDLSETEKKISELEHLDVLDANTDEVEAKLDKIDANTDGVEYKLDKIDSNTDGVENLISTANSRLNSINSWMTETEQTVGALAAKLNSVLDKLDTIIENQGA